MKITKFKRQSNQSCPYFVPPCSLMNALLHVQSSQVLFSRVFPVDSLKHSSLIVMEGSQSVIHGSWFLLPLPHVSRILFLLFSTHAYLPFPRPLHLPAFHFNSLPLRIDELGVRITATKIILVNLSCHVNTGASVSDRSLAPS